MMYHSTRSKALRCDSAQAVLEGLAADGGLYMPEKLPEFDWNDCLTGDSQSMATKILTALLPDIPDMEDLVAKGKYLYARCYVDGLGTDFDRDKSVRLMLLAQKSGSPEATAYIIENGITPEMLKPTGQKKLRRG